MNTSSRSTRAPLSSIALLAALAPLSALASSGLVVKLLDGSEPIVAPDIFANAYAKAWNANGFCTALKAYLTPSYANSAATVIQSCSAPAYGQTGIASHGLLGAYVTFTAPISVQGTQQFYQETPQGKVTVNCTFTDRVNFTTQDALSLPETVVGSKPRSVSFAAPILTATVSSETWGPPCSNGQDEHPGGISSQVVLAIPGAASSVNFPGSALIDALSPYQTTIEKDLSAMIYRVSVATGDVEIQVTNSILRAEVEDARSAARVIATTGDAKTSTSSGGSTAASGTKAIVDWGTAANSSGTTPPGAASAINRSVGSALQQVRPQPYASAPSSLGGSH